MPSNNNSAILEHQSTDTTILSENPQYSGAVGASYSPLAPKEVSKANRAGVDGAAVFCVDEEIKVIGF
jgi:hypothetical protein